MLIGVTQVALVAVLIGIIAGIWIGRILFHPENQDHYANHPDIRDPSHERN